MSTKAATAHTVIGLYVTCLSLWWTYSACRRYFKSLSDRKQFKSSTTFVSHCFGKYIPLESFLGLFLSVFGLITTSAFMGNIAFKHAKGFQHDVVLFVFGLQCFVEITQFYKWNSMPSNITYFTYILAFIIETLNFIFHFSLFELEMLAHHLLALACTGCCVLFVVEYFVRDDVMITLARALCAFLQGTWLLHIGIIFMINPDFLHVKYLEKMDYNIDAILLVVYFSCHFVVDALIILLICFLVSRRYNKMDSVSLNKVESNHLLKINFES